MKAIHAFLVLCICSTTNAQNWCPPGAEWYYDYAEVSTGQDGYLHVEYVGDTVVNGDTYQILHRFLDAFDHQSQTYYSGYENPIYSTVTGGLIQMTYNFVDVDTIYDFDALPGDMWEPHLHSWYYTYQGIQVTDTGMTDIDGVSLKYLSVDYVNGVIVPQDTLIERLGFLWLPMDTYSGFIWDAGTYRLRCYFDDDISYYNPTFPSCDFILGLGDLEGRKKISVFPNPAADHVTIRGLEAGAHQFELYDASGRKLLETQVIAMEPISLSGLDSGTYLYRIRSNKNGSPFTGMLSKE